jgi:hypothetical protein
MVDRQLPFAGKKYAELFLFAFAGENFLHGLHSNLSLSRQESCLRKIKSLDAGTL